MNKKHLVTLVFALTFLLIVSSCSNQNKVILTQNTLNRLDGMDVASNTPKPAGYDEVIYDILPDKVNLLITLKGESGENRKITGLYLFDLKSKKTKRLFDNFPGTITVPVYLIDQFDPDNFIAEYTPQDSEFTQIGRFNGTKHQYTPILNIPLKNVEIERIFTDQNLVFYTVDNPSTYTRSFCMMKLDGSSQRNIMEGKSLFVFTHLMLDQDRFLLDGDYEEESSFDKMVFCLIYTPKQNTYLWIHRGKMVEPVKDFLGVYHNQLLFALIKENSTKVSFEMVDYDGKQRKTFSIPLNYRGLGPILIDEPVNRLFFGYTSMETKEEPDKKDRIILIDLLTDTAREIFSYTNTRSDIGICLNQTENTLFFTTNIYPEYKEKVCHRIHLDTFKEDTYSFPEPSSAYYSSDGDYLFSTFIDKDPTKHGIFNCKTKKLTLLKEKITLTKDSYALDIPITKQYLVITNDADQSKYLYFVDMDGNLTRYTL